MARVRSELEDLALQFYRDQKRTIDLVRMRVPHSGFEIAVRRVFGDTPTRGKTTRIGNSGFKFSSLTSSLVSFLPVRWQEELDRTGGQWRGCENWWAGFPLIMWIEMRTSTASSGHLHLYAEVGPISAHAVRKGVIEAIEVVASEGNWMRIKFPAGASDRRQLYSRFLQGNMVDVNDIRRSDEVERKLVGLVNDFEPEIGVITRIIPQLPFERA